MKVQENGWIGSGRKHCLRKKERVAKRMMEEKVQRINELYRKSQEEGLNAAEKKEQQELRGEYIAAIRASLRGQLDRIDIQEEDGSITHLEDKYDKKGTHQANSPC